MGQAIVACGPLLSERSSAARFGFLLGLFFLLLLNLLLANLGLLLQLAFMASFLCVRFWNLVTKKTLASLTLSYVPEQLSMHSELDCTKNLCTAAVKMVK